jgi:hypothetical protein
MGDRKGGHKSTKETDESCKETPVAVEGKEINSEDHYEHFKRRDVRNNDGLVVSAQNTDEHAPSNQSSQET